MKHQIRPVRENDINQIVNLIKDCDRLEAHSPFIYWILSNYFQNTTIVAQSNKNADILGFASAITSGKDPSTGYIWQVIVEPNYRKNGLGRELVKSIILLCKEKEIKRLEFSIEPDNHASLNMVAKAFSDLGIEKKMIGEIDLSVESINWHEQHNHFMALI